MTSVARRRAGISEEGRIPRAGDVLALPAAPTPTISLATSKSVTSQAC